MNYHIIDCNNEGFDYIIKNEFHLSFFDTKDIFNEDCLHVYKRGTLKECLFRTDWIEINKYNIHDKTLYFLLSDIQQNDNLRKFRDIFVYVIHTKITNILFELGSTPNDIRYSNGFANTHIIINLSDEAISKILDHINNNSILCKFLWHCNIIFNGIDKITVCARIHDIEKIKENKSCSNDNWRISISI